MIINIYLPSEFNIHHLAGILASLKEKPVLSSSNVCNIPASNHHLECSDSIPLSVINVESDINHHRITSDLESSIHESNPSNHAQNDHHLENHYHSITPLFFNTFEDLLYGYLPHKARTLSSVPWHNLIDVQFGQDRHYTLVNDIVSLTRVLSKDNKLFTIQLLH
jgi:hypothetical protein